MINTNVLYSQVPMFSYLNVNIQKYLKGFIHRKTYIPVITELGKHTSTINLTFLTK